MIHTTIELARKLAASTRDYLTPESSALQIAQRVTLACVLFISTGIMPVAAQGLNETSSSLCGTGLETIYVLIVVIIVLGGFILGSIEGGRGFFKYDNPDPGTSKEGEDMIRSGLWSMGGPVLFFTVVTVALEATGFEIASCFVPDLGFFGGTIMPALGAFL